MTLTYDDIKCRESTKFKTKDAPFRKEGPISIPVKTFQVLFSRPISILNQQLMPMSKTERMWLDSPLNNIQAGEGSTPRTSTLGW